MPTLEIASSQVLVGRTREIGLLNQALRAAQQGAGRCVLLAGEAGIGKSRLVAEIRSHAEEEHWIVLQGHCSERDNSFPYAPWIDALRAFLAPKSAQEITHLLGPLSGELVKLLPELSLLAPEIHPTPVLNTEAEKHRQFESVTRFLLSLSASRPSLVILEDLHWSDETSLDLLQFAVHRIASSPILIVATFRTEDLLSGLTRRVAALERSPTVEEIAIGPLARSEVEQMVRALQGPHRSIGVDGLDTLARLTEGNPFFVEEMLKSLPPSGSLGYLQIPPSVQRLVQQQIDQLTERQRRVLSLAAIIGERFDFGLLREVTSEDEPSLLRILKQLLFAQLLVEKSGDEFAFRHALTREAVYMSLLQRERRAMHQVIGETLERLAGGRDLVPAAPLAYHYYHGQAWPKALAFSQRAGEQAQVLYAPREALVHFTHAADAAERLGAALPIPVRRGRAQVYDVLGEFENARADYELLLESARRNENRVDEWQSLLDLGLLWQARDLPRAGEYYERALVLARNLGNSSMLGKSLNRVGNWQMNLGHAHEALVFHREAYELFRGLDDRRGMAQTLDLLGIVSYQLGEVVQGAAYLEHAIPIFRELDDRQSLVNTLTSLTLRAITDSEVLGDVSCTQLTKPSDEAFAIAHSFHWDQGEALALLHAAISLRQAGEYRQALERLARARSMVEESQNRELFARLHLVTGELLSDLLSLSEASEHLNVGLKIVHDLGSGILALGATSGLAMVAILQKDLPHAKALLVKLLPGEYPAGGESPPLRRCWRACAELELAQGNPSRALDIVERLLAATRNLEQYGPYAVPRLSHLRGRSLTSLGRLDEAESELQGALTVARAQGLRPLVWRMKADLGRVYRAMKSREKAEQEFSTARRIIEELASDIPEGTIPLLTGDSGISLHEAFLQRALLSVPAIRAPTALQAAKKEFGGLTARERQIASLIARGKSNHEIADELVISEKTTERHVSNILLKLGFGSRTQIAAWALKMRIDK